MYNPLDLSDRRILVTGASSGIGRTTSVILSRLGAKLTLAARSEEALQETETLLEGDGHVVAPCDLRESSAIPGWMKQLAKEHGPFSGAVHSAGMHFTLPLRFQTEDKLDELMKLNFTAGVQLAKGLRQKKVCTQPASLVFVSSVMGLVGQPGVSAYVASKGALVSLARSLALELANEKIRVNCVAPGQVRSKMADVQQEALTEEQQSSIEAMHPLGIGEPEDVANAVAFLLADSGRWITGTTLVVDGGYTAH